MREPCPLLNLSDQECWQIFAQDEEVAQLKKDTIFCSSLFMDKDLPELNLSEKELGNVMDDIFSGEKPLHWAMAPVGQKPLSSLDILKNLS